MSLATTCPTCKTSFRVVPDQLKLRRGLVRCGACHCVFSGVDALRHLPDPADVDRHLRGDDLAREDEREIPALLADISPAAGDGRERERIADAAPDTLPMTEPDAEPEPEAEPGSPASAVLAEEKAMPDPWAPLRPFREPTEFETPKSARDVAPEPDPGIAPAGAIDSSANDAGESIPADGAAPLAQVEEDEEDAIDFFARGSGRRIGWRPRSAVARSIALVLGLVLAVQLALGGRDWLAAYFPQTRPWLDVLAQAFGLQVELLRRPDAVTIESFELTSSNMPGSYRLSALLRSRADTAVQWPAIELSLTDAAGAIIVRRVLTARDYLADPSIVGQGLPARSEYPVLVGLEFGDLTPTGYSALLFYP